MRPSFPGLKFRDLDFIDRHRLAFTEQSMTAPVFAIIFQDSRLDFLEADNPYTPHNPGKVVQCPDCSDSEDSKRRHADVGEFNLVDIVTPKPERLTYQPFKPQIVKVFFAKRLFALSPNP